MEKNWYVEKFQILLHNRRREIWNFSTWRWISHFSTWQIWRHLKFTLIFVAKSFLCLFILFCRDSRAFVLAEKRWQMWGLGLALCFPSEVIWGPLWNIQKVLEEILINNHLLTTAAEEIVSSRTWGSFFRVPSRTDNGYLRNDLVVFFPENFIFYISLSNKQDTIIDHVRKTLNSRQLFVVNRVRKSEMFQITILELFFVFYN